jgi:soluble lytic murein transglycosylase
VTAVLLLAALTVARPAAADDEAATRTLFRVAYAAAQAGSGAPEASDSAALRAYPLYPYLQTARLEQSVQDDAAIGAFLDEHRDAPYTSRLRRLWLEDLARRGRWQTYLARYPADTDAPTLRCHALAARAALGGDAELEQAIVEQWLTPRSLPDACDPAVHWLRSRKALTADLIEQRARMALAEGESQLARYLAKSLRAPVAAPLLQWAALIEKPEHSLDELIEHPGRDVEPEALLAGWTVLARRDPEASTARFAAFTAARDLDARLASPYALATALGLAWSRRPGALEYFSLVRPDDFDDVAHEWHVRAALWAGDWARAEQAIAAMPDTLRKQNRWRYWAARAREAVGEREAARAGYADVVPTDNWYAALAAARLGQRFTPSLQVIPLDQRAIDELALSPAFVRVRELLLCDLTSEAGTEWRVAYDLLAPSQQLQAIGLADRWGWHYQAIAAAASQTLFNDYPLLYPRPYDGAVGAAARLTNLPPELIYAVIRQESLYRPDAGSSAGALGLMQLLPSTARRAAQHWGLKAPDRAELLQPGVNIPIGAGELRSLLDRFDGQTLLATAAYNAGQGAVRRWLPDTTMESDVWVENIPFNETRTYVQRVAWHSLVFGWLDDRKPRDVANWLGSLRLPGALPAGSAADLAPPHTPRSAG